MRSFATCPTAASPKRPEETPARPGPRRRVYVEKPVSGLRLVTRFLPAPLFRSHLFYIHGKVIEADYGTAHGKVFIGSENFSSTSLNDNRELGLIISSHAVMSAIAATFAGDFRNGQHWH